MDRILAVVAIFLLLAVVFYQQHQISNYQDANRNLVSQLISIEMRNVLRDGKEHDCIRPDVNARVFQHTITYPNRIPSGKNNGYYGEITK